MKKIADIEVGKIYWVAGRGPMKVSELPDPNKKKITVTLITPGEFNYYAASDDLMYELTAEQLREYRTQIELRLNAPESVQTLTSWIAELT